MWQVFSKELKELLRDRKTLIFIIALPMLIFPLIFGGFGYLAGKIAQKENEKVLSYAVIGAEHNQQLASKFNQHEGFELVDLPLGSNDEIVQAIRSGEVSFVLEIGADIAQKLEQHHQANLMLHLNDASAISRTMSKVQDIVDEFNQGISRAEFARLGYDAEQQKGMVTPVVVDKVDVSDKRENIGEKIGAIIPYMVIILLLQGAMSSALDLGAGEKERGTLETLLITPLDRHELVLGKFFTICVAGVVTAFITIFSFVLWGTVLGQAAAIDFLIEFMGAISLLDFTLMFLMLVPVAVIIAATLLSISIYAKSFKEGQSYAGSLVIIFIVPVALSMLPGIKLEGIWAWVPITNVSLAIKELIKGTMDYWMLLSIFASTFIIGMALLSFCVYWFKQEKVLFR